MPMMCMTSVHFSLIGEKPACVAQKWTGCVTCSDWSVSNQVWNSIKSTFPEWSEDAIRFRRVDLVKYDTAGRQWLAILSVLMCGQYTHVISPPLHVYFQPLNKDLKWAKMKNDVVSAGGALYLGIERIYACQ